MQKHHKSISQVSLRVIFILYISSEAERELCVRKMQSFVLGISYFFNYSFESNQYEMVHWTCLMLYLQFYSLHISAFDFVFAFD